MTRLKFCASNVRVAEYVYIKYVVQNALLVLVVIYANVVNTEKIQAGFVITVIQILYLLVQDAQNQHVNLLMR